MANFSNFNNYCSVLLLLFHQSDIFHKIVVGEQGTNWFCHTTSSTVWNAEKIGTRQNSAPSALHESSEMDSKVQRIIKKKRSNLLQSLFRDGLKLTKHILKRKTTVKGQLSFTFIKRQPFSNKVLLWRNSKKAELEQPISSPTENSIS